MILEGFFIRKSQFVWRILLVWDIFQQNHCFSSLSSSLLLFHLLSPLSSSHFSYLLILSSLVFSCLVSPLSSFLVSFSPSSFSVSLSSSLSLSFSLSLSLSISLSPCDVVCDVVLCCVCRCGRGVCLVCAFGVRCVWCGKLKKVEKSRMWIPTRLRVYIRNVPVCSLSLFISSLLSLLILCVVVCRCGCGCRVVVIVACVVWHTENPVCPSKTPPCVHSKRPRVYRHHAHTRNPHTGGGERRSSPVPPVKRGPRWVITCSRGSPKVNTGWYSFKSLRTGREQHAPDSSNQSCYLLRSV